jgi:hypothetical protein
MLGLICYNLFGLDALRAPCTGVSRVLHRERANDPTRLSHQYDTATIPKAWQSIDNKNVDLAGQEDQLQTLRGHVDKWEVKKQRRVQKAEPNSKFVEISNSICARHWNLSSC